MCTPSVREVRNDLQYQEFTYSMFNQQDKGENNCVRYKVRQINII